MKRVIIALLCLSFLSVTGIAEEPILKMPVSIQEINSEAFCGDTSLSKVILPDSLKRIGEHAFAFSSVKTINLPDSINFIADNAFEGCVFEYVDARGEYCQNWCAAHGIKVGAYSDNETELAN